MFLGHIITGHLWCHRPVSDVSRLMALVFWFGFPRIRPWVKNSNAVSLSEGGRNIKGEQVGESNMGKNRWLLV